MIRKIFYSIPASIAMQLISIWFVWTHWSLLALIAYITFLVFYTKARDKYKNK